MWYRNIYSNIVVYQKYIGTSIKEGSAMTKLNDTILNKNFFLLDKFLSFSEMNRIIFLFILAKLNRSNKTYVIIS